MTTKLILGEIIESSLYVADPVRSRAFYERVLGLTVASEPLERLCPLRVTANQVLLLFKRGASMQPHVTPGGVIPPSDGSGELHVTFSISPRQFTAWQERLRQCGVVIESVVSWDTGGHALYFRDPDRHLIELKTSPWNEPEFPW